MKSFRNKNVVITGAGSGIGRSTALAFARAGANVHVVDLDESRANTVAKEVEANGVKAFAHAVDCSKYENVSALAEKTYELSGRIDVLHNNAGVGHAGLTHETSIEDWERVLSINLWGTIYGIHAYVPRMLQQDGERHIVNTASGLGLMAVPGMAPYCATKFAVVGISESIRAELEPSGIAVSVVCPGVINTDIVNSSKPKGSTAAHHEEAKKLFETRGASPDLVAHDILEGLRKNRPVIITPARHVLPMWLVKRASTAMYASLAKRVGKKVLGQNAADLLSASAPTT